MKNIAFWAVGATFDEDDMSSEFLNSSTWWDGYADNNDERNRNILEKINIGDVLVMKSSSTKGPGHSITFTKLKNIGIVEERLKYYYFKVRWLVIKDLPKDFDGISYRKTVEIIRDDEMYRYVQNIIEMDSIQNKVDILNYKKQIILQGPPGTGKTRLAKMIAKKMTDAKEVGSPILKIDNFFKTFDTSKPEVKLKRVEMSSILDNFLHKFPKSEIKDLSLESYAIGTGGNDSFCWWIERGLKPLGYYFPGSARSYLIYWSKDLGAYSTHFKHSKLLSEVSDLEDSMSKLAGVLSELVLTKNSKDGFKILGDSFMLKILNSYYPEEYFPVNSVPCLNNILKLLQIDYSKLNFIEKNLRVQQIFNEKKAALNQDVTNLEFMRFLFDNFNLKGELPILTDAVLGVGESKFIQFHPAYSYEDFVRGITAKTNANSQVEYKVENKTLAIFAQRALDNPSANYVLVIDEINRANLPSVLGELIYALEYRFDPENPNETTVDSMYSIADPDGLPESYDEGRKLKLPINLFIIGTMNTADRSVGHIDYAIRRRFAFVDMQPQKSVIDEVITEISLRQKAHELYDKVESLFSSKTLASDFNKNDVQIGHSYFLAKTHEELNFKLNYEIKPILKEYLKDGVLLTEINSDGIDETLQFINNL